MVFSSLNFIYIFLPLILIIYYLCKNRMYRNTILLLGSLFFYAWGEPRYIVVMLISVCSAYIGGLLIDYCERVKSAFWKKFVLIATITILVGLLFLFKYLNLFADTLNHLFAGNITFPALVLPIGISFYTFQILSYVIDLYRGKVKLQKSLFDLMLYVSFFPQLIAGPIVRYETIEYELSNRKERWDDFISGTELFILGLSKKVLLANRLAKLSEDLFALGVEQLGTVFVWLAVLSYTCQIYFDFSGYSDMAIGLGRMFGFHFPENFNYPYCATSITEFWRRWHISLSTWFRDYIYIPLGGNRVPKNRHIMNILITWALTGFWHGASWNFLLWGIYYACLLLLEKYLLSGFLKRMPILLQWMYTFFLTLIGWVIFSKESIGEIVETLKGMFVYAPSSPVDMIASNSSLISSMLILPFAILFSFPVLKKFLKSEGFISSLSREILCIILFCLCIISLLSSSYNPFIYFRF